MGAGWQFFRVFCGLHLLVLSFLLLQDVFYTITGFAVSFGSIMSIIVSALAIALASLALELLGRNWPDTPVEGNQKKRFNRLFLLNFIFLVFQFGFFFSEWQNVSAIAELTKQTVLQLPAGLLLTLGVYLFVIIGQFIVLVGLYRLRRELYENGNQKQFEFEQEK